MILNDRYEYDPVNDLLGSGGFADVYKAYDKQLERTVALKVFRLNDNNKIDILGDMKRMSKLDHPNIIKCMDIFTLQYTDMHGRSVASPVGVMEYANKGTLKDILSKPPEEDVSKDILLQILDGLGYLHQMGIVHRDLKPQNILLHEHRGKLIPKITDFGISKEIENETTVSSAVIGTLNYMAPEQFEPEIYGVGGKLTFNIDIWSFGVIAYEFTTGKRLFGSGEDSNSSAKVIKKIMDFNPAMLRDAPAAFLPAIQRCLIMKASERPANTAEIVRLLSGITIPFRRDPSPAPSPAAVPVNRKNRWLPVAFIGGIIIITAAVWILFPRKKVPPPVVVSADTVTHIIDTVAMLTRDTSKPKPPASQTDPVVKPVNPLVGKWVLTQDDEEATYWTFQNNGISYAKQGKEKYKFSYKTKGSKIFLTVLEGEVDAEDRHTTMVYHLKGNTLKLTTQDNETAVFIRAE